MRLNSTISLYRPLHDHRGNIVALVDPTTSKGKECYRYTAFGEREIYDESGASLSKSNLHNPWGFASKRHDAETGFVYFSRRYFAPEIGRWITADPAGFADGPNLYAHVHNNPLTRFDLYGLYGEREMDYSDDDTFLESVFDQYCLTIRSQYNELTKISGDFGRRLYEHPVDTAQGICDSAVSTWKSANSLTMDKIGQGLATTLSDMVDFCKDNNADTIAAHFLASVTPGPESFLKNPGKILHALGKEEKAAAAASNAGKKLENTAKGGKNIPSPHDTHPGKPSSFKDLMSPKEAKRYDNFWKKHAPEQSAPYSTYRRYTPNGDIKQVTTYDQFGCRRRQYDFLDDLGRKEHQHNFSYGPLHPRPSGKRSNDHFLSMNRRNNYEKN